MDHPRYLRPKRWLALLAALGAPGLAFATNGYFAHGYGIKSQGIAGVGIALPQDGLAAATNPAGTAFVGDRLDIGLTGFRPSRGSEIKGNLFGADQSFSGNGSENFLIPEVGYTRQVTPAIALGVAVYGNGGMDTDYGSNPFARFGGTGQAGIDLAQLFVSPSIAYKLTQDHAVGLAVNVAYQQFKAKGLGVFAGFSSDPGKLTNNGVDAATGWGVRLGYTGKIAPNLTVGLTWSSKTKMGDFDQYKGLFAESGGFDIPANYGAGIAWQSTPALTLAADIEKIDYSKVKSVGAAFGNLLAGNLLGAAGGPGFGWKDVTVVKVGGSYELNPDWTVRAGYSHASQPIPTSQTFLNVLAPGVVQDHLTLGATWKNGKSGELSLSYGHAFKTTVKGAGSIPPGFPPGGFGGGEANVRLSEDIIGIAYGWKL